MRRNYLQKDERFTKADVEREGVDKKVSSGWKIQAYQSYSIAVPFFQFRPDTLFERG